MRVSKAGNDAAGRLLEAVEARNVMTREEAIAKLRAAGTRLPRGFKFDRQEANARQGVPDTSD